MGFVVWACRVMHILSAVIWLGGLAYCNAVLEPLAESENLDRSRLVILARRRFFPFVWSALWTALCTGILLMLLNKSFRWLDWTSPWSQLLVVKEAAFFLMCFFSWQSGKVLAKMEAAGDREEFDGWRRTFQKLTGRTLACGMVVLLCSSAMMVSGS
jgi:uncharacterized membrane protein